MVPANKPVGPDGRSRHGPCKLRKDRTGPVRRSIGALGEKVNTIHLTNFLRAVLIIASLAMIVGPDLSVATTSLVWSANPGAVEQHLMRRHNNLLFRKDRRQITQSEINVARERDLRDFEKLNNRLILLLEDISVLPDHVDSSTIKKIRERIDDLIQDAMGVGGKAYDIATETKRLRKVLISTWAEGISNNSEAQRALLAAEIYYQENAPKFEIPFVAQMVRENRSIPSEEVIPALLMEQPNTIALTISWLKPDKRSAFQKAALQVLKSALEEGAQISNLEQILGALGVETK